MLDFPKKFLEAEVREDFLIDSTMKTVWAAQLEILQAVAEVCDKYDLKWYAAYGTLLGAARHGGFIPWDDDVDIMMMRADFMKLLEVLPGELPREFHVQSAFSREMFTEYHARVLNADSISIAPERLEKFHGCPFAVGIDIFPLDCLPASEGERIVQMNLFTMARQVVWYAKDADRTEENLSEFHGFVEAVQEYCRVKIDPDIVGNEQRWRELVQPMWKLANQLAMMYNTDGSDDLVMFMSYAQYPEQIFRREWFDETVELPFEEFALPAPRGYKEFLTAVYGDYNVRRRSYDLHDYPFYKKQLEILREQYRAMEEAAKRS